MPINHPTPSAQRKNNEEWQSEVVKIRPDSIIGSLVQDRYRITARIARGGMSAVYLARDIKNNKDYAIKVLRGEYVLEPRLRERFFNESRAVQRVDHPVVVRLYDVGETDDGRIFLVMEYVLGDSLRRRIERRPLSLLEAVPLIVDMTKGLGAAHDKGVVHRDLKPENVLLPMWPQSDALVKIVDFGIARIIDAPRITTTQHVMGTPHYIAPEQAMGNPVDHRADIYTLGVLMYEMLTGELPFAGDDPDWLLRQHISAPPPQLFKSPDGADFPQAMRELVMRCLAKMPWDRPNSMCEVADCLLTV